MVFEIAHADGYTIDDDVGRFDLERAHGWISGQSYWAEGIPRDLFARATANSLTFGAYAADGTMAGFGRVVTDRATFGWLCDVFVDEASRGRRLGHRLVEYVKAHPGLRRLHLATRDAHGLYSRYGFGPLTAPDGWMEIRDPDVYRRQP